MDRDPDPPEESDRAETALLRKLAIVRIDPPGEGDDGVTKRSGAVLMIQTQSQIRVSRANGSIRTILH